MSVSLPEEDKILIRGLYEARGFEVVFDDQKEAVVITGGENFKRIITYKEFIALTPKKRK